jgi:hypothetical protein
MRMLVEWREITGSFGHIDYCKVKRVLEYFPKFKNETIR